MAEEGGEGRREEEERERGAAAEEAAREEWARREQEEEDMLLGWRDAAVEEAVAERDSELAAQARRVAELQERSGQQEAQSRARLASHLLEQGAVYTSEVKNLGEAAKQ